MSKAVYMVSFNCRVDKTEEQMICQCTLCLKYAEVYTTKSGSLYKCGGCKKAEDEYRRQILPKYKDTTLDWSSQFGYFQGDGHE